MKILFLTNVPSPYRVDFFNELGKECELTVLFEKNTSDERDSSWKKYNFNNFEGIFLKGHSVDVDSAFCPEVIKYINSSFDHIIVSNFLTPTGMFAISYMRLKHIEYWLESDGGFAKDGKGIKEQIKKHFIKNAKGYFSTADEHDKYYITYGADPQKIFRYPFTSLKNIDLLPFVPTQEEKAALRERLGLKEKKIIISVGRFSYQNGYGKGFDILSRISKKLGSQYGIYIIGDKPTDSFLQENDCANIKNLHFIDFMRKEELSLYYRAADVFVLLSRGDVWGLVVNEAMAHALPVISSDQTIAGLELVQNGKNGYVVSLDDEDVILGRIKAVVDDCEVQNQMAKNSRELINRYSIENMSSEHIKIIRGGVQRMDKVLPKKKI